MIWDTSMKLAITKMVPRIEKVVLCRGSTEKNDTHEVYVTTLKTAGYECECLRTLRFDFVNLPELRICLQSPDTYRGLILTSKRTVEAIGLAIAEDRSILDPWKKLPAYCVGPATESFCKSHLRLENCLGGEAGSAKELAEKIIAFNDKSSKPLLYPCSEIARETIETTLTNSDTSVRKIIVYKTLPSECLEQDLLEFTDGTPRIFVFFSPSTVEYIINIWKKKFYDTSSIKAVAIGPVTRQALLGADFDIYAMANKPDPVALLQAINDAEKGDIGNSVQRN